MKNRFFKAIFGSGLRFWLLVVCAGLTSVAAGISSASAQVNGYALGTAAVIQGPAAGSNTVVLAGLGAWTATANDSWLHLDVANQSGMGSTNVLFTFDANPGATRTGTLTIAGQTLTVAQAGSNYIAVNVVGDSVYPVKPTTVAVDFKGDIFSTTWLEDQGYLVDWWAYDTPRIPQLANTAIDSGDGLATVCLAMDGAGNLYDAVANYPPGGTLVEWIAATETTVTLTSSTNLASIGPLAADSAGNAFIVGNDGTVFESSITNRSLRALVSSNSGIADPISLAVDKADNLYVVDGSVNAIKEWMPANNNVITLVSNLLDPRGLVVDGSGNVYFADAGNSTLQEWTAASGTVILLYSNLNGIVDAHYYIQPVQLAISPSSNVYIAAYSNDVILLCGSLFLVHPRSSCLE